MFLYKPLQFMSYYAPLTDRDLKPKDMDLASSMHADPEVRDLAARLFRKLTEYRYSYNFSWLGRPIIQYPQDIVAIQEIICNVKPTVVIETGVAHGGSLMLSASVLKSLGNGGRVIGIDVEIRKHNRDAIESHPLSEAIILMEGSSTSDTIAAKVRKEVRESDTTLVILDSNHSHNHVLEELRRFSPLVSKGSYIIVMDTVIEFLPPEFFPDRPWSRGNNAYTAVHEFLATQDDFEIDEEYNAKLLISVSPDGYLRRVK